MGTVSSNDAYLAEVNKANAFALQDFNEAKGQLKVGTIENYSHTFRTYITLIILSWLNHLLIILSEIRFIKYIFDLCDIFYVIK